MALQNEESVITLKINADAAGASINEMTTRIKTLQNAIYNLHQEDNPAKYESIRSQLNALIIARDAEKQKILETATAHKQYVKDMQSGMKDLEGQTNSFKSALTSLAGSLGITFSIAALLSFGKELLDIEVKASGIERAFTRIGDTTGLIDKLRSASRGMISDMDLEKLAVRASEFTVPMSKLPLLLDFAAQRARDTGKDVTELTNKLIDGLGRRGGRALVELGISSTELNDELRKTPDRVDAIGNIIKRRMTEAGEDVDNLGDRVLKTASMWDNMKQKLASFWEFVKNPMAGSLDPDQKDLQIATNKEAAKFKDIEKLKGDELETALKNQAARVNKLNQEGVKLQKQWDDAIANNDSHAAIVRANQAVRANKLIAAAAQNVLGALNNRKVDVGLKQDEEGAPGTVKYFDLQIAALKKTQAEVANTSEAWKKYQAQIDALGKQKEAITGKSTPAEKKIESEREATLKAFKQLAIERQQFEAAELADTLAANEKQLQQLQNRYDKEIDKQKEFLTRKGVTKKEAETTAQNIAALQQEKAKAVAALELKQEQETGKAIQEFHDKLAGKLETELQKETDQINQKFNELAGKYDDDDLINQMAIEAARQDELNTAKLRNEQRFQEDKRKIDEEGLVDSADFNKVELARIQKKYDDEVAALKKKYGEELLATKEGKAALDALNKNRENATNQLIEKTAAEKRKKTSEEEIKMAREVNNSIFEIGRRNRQATAEAEVRSLEDQKNNELNNKNLTAQQRADIEKKYADKEAEVKLKAWKADQEAAIAQAIINGALAMTKIAAQTGVLSFAFDPVILAETALQVATIAAERPPQFASGGIVDGPSHAEGGVSLVNNKTGRVMGEVEGGEPLMVLSNATRQNNGALINQLLFNSMYRNGAAVDVAGVSRGITMARNGGVFNSHAQTTSPAPAAPQSGGAINSADLSETNRRLANIEQHFLNFSKKPWDFNNRAYHEYLNKLDNITQKATT